MLSPGESINPSEVINPHLVEELKAIDPSMNDLLCSYLEKEIQFFVEVRKVSKELEEIPFSQIWDSLSQNSYIDEFE
jgi:hypothetical protein